MSKISANRSPKLDPALLIVFGLSGDLARRKLLPALYYLAHENLLPDPFEIIGISRRDITVDELLKDVELCVNDAGHTCHPATIKKLRGMITMRQMNLTNAADYKKLLTYLNQREDTHDQHLNRLYYLSIPPQVFGPVVRLLGEQGHNASCQHGAANTRLLIEKPFGYDYQSGKELIADIGQQYADFQVYRVDHYLAKETVQNILTFRFANPIFEAVWNKKHVSHIQITAAETLGVEGRGAFYEQTGALRDIIQSHLVQLLALVTMEKPRGPSAKSLHTAKLRLLKSIEPIAPNKVVAQSVRGQYESYREDVEHPNSNVETYAAVALRINNRRWKGVPVLLRTGKHLAAKATEVTVVFKQHQDQSQHVPNTLTFRLQPNEGITFNVLAKQPGLGDELKRIALEFNYTDTNLSLHPDSYERVLLDGIRGDKTLFSTSEEILAAWKVFDNVIHTWAKNGTDLESYHKQSWGPLTADLLAARHHATWLVNDADGAQTNE